MLSESAVPYAAALDEAPPRADRRQRPVLVSSTRPIAERDAIAFFAQAAPAEHRWLWLRPDAREALAGVGAAATLSASGPDRFRCISATWADLVEQASIETNDGGGPLLFGGFSFDPLSGATASWAGFPDARMVLPERMLTLRGSAAWLTTNTLAGATRESEAPTRYAPAPSSLDDYAWRGLVSELASGIRDGSLGVEKVVLARAHEVATRTDPETALRRLAARYPTCTVFAVGHGDACFLGATPERLVTLKNGTASTMALAGSAARGPTPDADVQLADRLLHDPKERREHAIVANALRAGLDELCTRVVADAEPRVRALSNVQHLLTRMRGQVRPGCGVLDLVEKLHPTPAVGGYPTPRALELIRERERLDRGWYAAPMGFLDARREGDFVVALRSALLRGDTATLFAGCGIVGDSDPAAEYAEWGWKLRPMLSALGVAA